MFHLLNTHFSSLLLLFFTCHGHACFCPVFFLLARFNGFSVVLGLCLPFLDFSFSYTRGGACATRGALAT